MQRPLIDNSTCAIDPIRRIFPRSCIPRAALRPALRCRLSVRCTNTRTSGATAAVEAIAGVVIVCPCEVVCTVPSLTVCRVLTAVRTLASCTRRGRRYTKKKHTPCRGQGAHTGAGITTGTHSASLQLARCATNNHKYTVCARDRERERGGALILGKSRAMAVRACVCGGTGQKRRGSTRRRMHAQACAQAKGASGPGGMHSGHKCMGRAVM